MEKGLLYKIYKVHPEVTTDSRHCPEGSLFFALKGDSFDGNRFAAKALEAGAAAAVVDDPSVIPAGDDRYLLVDDVLTALQQLAAHHRQQFKEPVLQITGTNGKTTTKELIAKVLGTQFNVLYTQGNLNNHIGVPLTLLRLRPGTHDIAVIETGANHPGEIAFLTNIVQPDYGLITNVGRAHLEGFGSFEGVKNTKGELYDYLSRKRKAHLFINTCDKDLMEMMEQRDIDGQSDKCIGYTHTKNSSQTTAIVHGHVTDCTPFVHVQWQDLKGTICEDVATRLIGDYNLDNIMAAICVGVHFGIPPHDISKALAEYQPSLGRSEFRETATNELIIDAYNANYTSMLLALENFRHITHPQKMVILGDMKEMGTSSEEAHMRVISEVIGSDVRTAWFVGSAFKDAVSKMPHPEHVQWETYPDVEAVKEALATNPPHGSLILIKGSNSTRLHQLPDLL